MHRGTGLYLENPGLFADGSSLIVQACQFTSRQRFAFYRDLSTSNAIGIQNAFSGSMLYVSYSGNMYGNTLKMDSIGFPGDWGTFYLRPSP